MMEDRCCMNCGRVSNDSEQLYYIIVLPHNIIRSHNTLTNTKLHTSWNWNYRHAVALLLIALTLLPSYSLGKPIKSTMSEVDSCKVDCLESTTEVTVEQKKQLLEQIQQFCDRAKTYIDDFKDNYTWQIFHQTFLDLLAQTSHVNAETIPTWGWLPKITKKTGENVSQDVLDALIKSHRKRHKNKSGRRVAKGGRREKLRKRKNKELEKEVQTLYEYFQVYAVGLEQVTLDQALYGGEFQENFRQSEKIVSEILCELKRIMCALGITAPANVDRSIMAPNLRDIDSPAQRNMRDWVIFRDYSNAIEYSQQVLAFMIRNL